LSVIVRTRDSARTLQRALDSLRAQTVDVEIVVVDSGSQDETLDLARRGADLLIEIPPSAYTPGHALNVGAAAAVGEIVGALSSHCELASDVWAEHALAHFADPAVAGVAGSLHGPDGPLTGPVRHTAGLARRHPQWGFSNHASAWRATTWAREPFSESLATGEDREWALRVLDAGETIVYDPELWVDMSHRWKQGAVTFFRRERSEQQLIWSLYGLPAPGTRDLLGEWWRPPDTRHPPLFHRLNYRRAAGLVGAHLGRRAGAAQRHG
jgi:rhamnosyltransferase